MLAFMMEQVGEEAEHGTTTTMELSSWQATNAWTIFGMLLLTVKLLRCFHQFTGAKKSDLREGFHRYVEVKKNYFMHMMACPNRRRRQARCAKRRANRCADSNEDCAIMHCCRKLAELHLPAPLPWRKPNKKKKKSKRIDTPISEAAPGPQDSQEREDGKELAAVEPFVEVPQPATPLIDLARFQNWDMVVKQATRRGAKYRDVDGLLPLHWAVSGGPPLNAVEKLLELYPSAAKKLDKEGSSPLHFATHYAASPSVVEALLRAYPKAIRIQDRFGRSPLFHAVEKCVSMDGLKLLVQADPSMITVPCLPKEHRDLPLTRTTATMTPLHMAWVGVVPDYESRLGKEGCLTKRKICKPLEKAQLLLEAAFFHLKNVSPSVPKDYHFLSGAIALDLYLPDKVVPFAVEHFPKDLKHADEDGRLALSQAAATSQYSKERSDTLIALLLKAYKEAALLRDREGRYPLQLALQSGKTWAAGVSRLFEANPDAIREDDSSGLPPFAIAASLEAQEADIVSRELVGESSSSVSAMRRNDPFGILNAKQRNLLERARQRVEKACNGSSAEGNGAEEADPEVERLSTVLDLLRSEPSVLTT